MNNYDRALEFFVENGIKLDKSKIHKLKNNFDNFYDDMNEKYYDFSDKYSKKKEKEYNETRVEIDRRKVITDIKRAIEKFLKEYKIKKVKIEPSNIDLFVSRKSDTISYNVVDMGSTKLGFAIIIFLATGIFYRKTTNKNSINMSNSLNSNKVNEKFRKCLASANKNYIIKLESLSSNSINVSAIRK